MKVTVDINVLLDVFQKREPHYAASARILALVQQGEVVGVFPAHGFTTLYSLRLLDPLRACTRLFRHGAFRTRQARHRAHLRFKIPQAQILTPEHPAMAVLACGSNKERRIAFGHA